MIGRLMAAIAAPLLLAGCLGAGATIAPPSAVTSRTTLDERAAIAAENAYQAAAGAVLTARRAGLLSDATWAEVKRVDRVAHGRVRAVRAAYDAGNAGSYAEATERAWSAIRGLFGLLPAEEFNP